MSFKEFKMGGHLVYRNGTILAILNSHVATMHPTKKGKRKVQGVPQSQTAAFSWHQKEEKTDKTKQAQIEQTYERHQE